MGARRLTFRRLARVLVAGVATATMAAALVAPAQAAGGQVTPSQVSGIGYGANITLTLPGCNGALFGGENDSGVSVRIDDPRSGSPWDDWGYSKYADTSATPWTPTITVPATGSAQLTASCRKKSDDPIIVGPDQVVDYGTVSVSVLRDTLAGELIAGFRLLAPLGATLDPAVAYTYGMGLGHSLLSNGILTVTAPDGKQIWHKDGGAGARVVMQDDGNLVVYDYVNRASWSSGTQGNPGAKAVMQSDGNLVVYSATGKPLWWTGVDRCAIPPARPTVGVSGSDYVPIGLLRGEGLTGSGLQNRMQSPNGKYRLIVNGDGNIVLWNSDKNWPTWLTGASTDWTFLTLQKDGNLVRYTRAGQPLWWTGTSTGTKFVLQDDGNLVLYDAANKPLWQSGTAGR